MQEEIIKQKFNSNQLLSIVIPTYNREEFLSRCLDINIPLAREYNIQIFISDNASTDMTEDVVKKKIKDYEHLYYYKNSKNFGQENFEIALKYPDTKYIWLLGDTYQIPVDGLSCILNLIKDSKEEFDAIVINVEDRVVDVTRQNFDDQNKLLNDLGWHMTCISGLIYSAKLRDACNFDRFKGSNFTQTGVIFEQISNKKFLIPWIPLPSVGSIKIKDLHKLSWQSVKYDIWLENWSNFIFSLPQSYNLSIKLKCIKEHGSRTKMFSIKSLFSDRSKGILNIHQYSKYSEYSSIAVGSSKFIILFIAFMPQFIPKILIFTATIWRIILLKIKRV